MPKKADPLSPIQERFCEEYIVDLNATQAASRAGYSDKGLHQRGYLLLKTPAVVDRIAKLMAARSARTRITADRVLQELGRIGLSDLRHSFDENGRLRHPKDWEDDAAAAISSIKVVTRKGGDGEIEDIHEVKLWDKVSALEKLGKHLGMFIERHEHAGPNGGPIQTEGTTTLDMSKLTTEQLRAISSIRVPTDTE